MAFKRYKKFGARTVRKRARYSRRYYRRRYRKRRGYYRRGRRFPRSTEVKSVSFAVSHKWDFNTDIANTPLSFTPGFVSIVPSNQFGNNIVQGTNSFNRIGAKVRPCKLRFCGSLSLDRPFSVAEMIAPQSFHVRFLVYQIRGGNAEKAPYDPAYHPLAMETADGNLGAKQIKKLLAYYNGSDTTTQFTVDQTRENMGAGKTPLRLGIGGQFRMLYSKTFVLSDQHVSTKPFRIITKVPRRLVWPEVTNGGEENAPEANCRNAIYAVWFVIPQTVNPIGSIFLNYNCQLFFTDK